MKNKAVLNIVYAAIIAALYTALSLALAPISFGAVQFRVAEAMTILPIYSAGSIWGLALGCAITNFVGVSTGASILGFADVLFGTAATVISAILTRMLRKHRIKNQPLLATLPPVLVNAVVIGAELCAVTPGAFSLWTFLTYAAFVGIGQFGACTVLGLVLNTGLQKTRLSNLLEQI